MRNHLEIHVTRKHLGLSVTLNILLLIVVISGLFFVFLGAPAQYFTGSLIKAPLRPAAIVEDVKRGAFVVEYLHPSEEIKAKLGEKQVNIGEYNLLSTYEPIEVKSMNFSFEKSAQDLIENLQLIVDGKEHKTEFIWMDDLSLKIDFKESFIVEDKANLLINADLSKDAKGELIMHFSYADLEGTNTMQEIENQGVVGDKPDPKPQVIIIN